MTRWTNKTERTFLGLFEDRIDRCHTGPRRGQCNTKRIRADNRVGVDHAAAMLGHLLGRLNLLGRMNLADGFLRQWLVGARSALLDQPAFVESPGDRPEPR